MQAPGFCSETVRADGTVAREAFNFFRNVAVARGIAAFMQWRMWYGHTLIMLMAGITSISTSLCESAAVDGANTRQATLCITLPLLRPMMLRILATSLIGGMQMPDIAFMPRFVIAGLTMGSVKEQGGAFAAQDAAATASCAAPCTARERQIFLF